MTSRVMGYLLIALVDCSAIVGGIAHAPARAAVNEPAPTFVSVEPGVKFEVLDWGGPRDEGKTKALILLAGLRDTAIVYDRGRGPRPRWSESRMRITLSFSRISR